MTDSARLSGSMLKALTDGILRRWYPLVLDREQGGYYTNVTCDWALAPSQEKMIVTQARHVWTLAKVAAFVDGGGDFEAHARHGFSFLKRRMWDEEYGGFFQIRGRDGGPTDAHGWRDEKRAYGNAFAVYALAALYGQTRDPAVLELARQAFHWLEAHAFDPAQGGYFQFLTREGRPFGRSDAYQTRAPDASELGYKDQNSSIHLLEAYTELYRVWPDQTLWRQLSSLLALIRDRMVHRRGYLRLFFEPDWKPVSFRTASAEEREKNFGLDHVSFGHDYETAFLMLEASHALGLEGDERTLAVAKRMVDHALDSGWDAARGGFWDAGYYAHEDGRCAIVRRTKNWWAQAEGLNVLALFSRIFPDQRRYVAALSKQWEYVDRCVLDHERGDWFEGGIDREPHFRTGPKSHIWKCTYHTSRALMNCVAVLGGPGMVAGEGFARRQREVREFVAHWRERGAGMPARVREG